MASDFPASLDAFPDPLVNSPLNSPSHAALHQDVNDAVEKIEVKLGVGASDADDASVNQVLMADGAGGSAWESVTNSKIDTVGVPAQRVLVSDGAGSASWSGEASGLWKVSSGNFTTGVNTFDIPNVFSSLYKSYRVIFRNVLLSAASLYYIRLRNAGGAAAGGDYVYAGAFRLFGGGGADNNNALNGNTFFVGGFATNVDQNYTTFDLHNPHQTLKTGFLSQYTNGDAGAFINGRHNLTTQYTGLTVLTNAATTFTNGEWIVYGYRD
jgi:hypothetical protein